MSELANEENVEQLLMELNIKNYNPQTNIYKTWYKLPVKCTFIDKEGLDNVVLFKRKITICYKNSHKESILRSFLHEAGHLELLPVDLPLMVGFGYILSDYLNSLVKFDNPYLDGIKHVATAIGALLLYQFTFREYLAETYAAIKMGYKRWKNSLKLT
jgi:hypothetical protein